MGILRGIWGGVRETPLMATMAMVAHWPPAARGNIIRTALHRLRVVPLSYLVKLQKQSWQNIFHLLWFLFTSYPTHRQVRWMQYPPKQRNHVIFDIYNPMQTCKKRNNWRRLLFSSHKFAEKIGGKSSTNGGVWSPRTLHFWMYDTMKL